MRITGEMLVWYSSTLARRLLKVSVNLGRACFQPSDWKCETNLSLKVNKENIFLVTINENMET